MSKDKGNLDEELIEGCLKKDRKYQEVLYKRFAPKMYAICLSYTNDRDSAQDILQEGFIKVFENIKTYNSEGSLEGWIRRIVTNTAIDYYRHNQRIQKLIQSEKENTDKEVPDTILSKIGFDEILVAVRKLPEGARIVFNLYALEGYTHQEIADQLNISVGTSKSQYSRAKSLLQKSLQDMNIIPL